MLFHTFSDFSRKDTKSCYAYVVVDRTRKPRVWRAASRFMDETSIASVRGELMGLCAAIRHIPDDSNVVSYIDVDHIHNIFRKPDSYTELVDEILRNKDRFQSFQVQYLTKKRRNQIYHWCHRRSRFYTVDSAQMPDPIIGLGSMDVALMLQRKANGETITKTGSKVRKKKVPKTVRAA